MKSFAYFVIKVHIDHADEAFELLKAYVQRKNVYGSNAIIFMRVPEQKWPELRPVCERVYGRDLDHVRIDAEFTKSEINSSELLIAQVNRAPIIRELKWLYQWPEIANTNMLRMPWTLQIDDLIVSGWRSNWTYAGLLSTQCGESIVTGSAAELFRAVPGMQLRDIRRKSGEIVSGAWQLCGDMKPAPFTSETKGLVDVLRDVKQFQTRVVCHAYSEAFCPVMPTKVRDDAIAGKLPAAFFSAELFGEPDWEPGYQRLNAPQPALIVTKQFRKAIMSIGVKRLSYVPIQFA